MTRDEELAFIIDRVERHESKRAPYKALAERWERMYRLDPGFQRTVAEAIAEGQEQIILPTPFNVVNLSQRLLSTTPRIDKIPLDPNDKESLEYSEKCERWLNAMWSQVNWDQKRPVLGEAIWQVLVRGRFCFEIKWIRDALPAAMKKTAFPLLIRTLEPLNVGVYHNGMFTEYAYHRYESSLLDIFRRYPNLKGDRDPGSRLSTLIDNYEANDKKNEDTTALVVDYWETGEDGKVYNAILIEDEFAKPLEVTTYPFIPIVCGKGDYGVGIGDEYDGLSILHSIDGLWQYECRLTSQMATGLLWHFWPAITVMNEQGQVVEDIEISPGTTTAIPPGTHVDMHQIEPNVPLAQAVFTQVEGYIQQSTYPEVMYGQAPGELQAGYGVNLLADAAKGRIKNFQESLEQGIAHVNKVALALVEKKAGKKGVDIFVVDDVGKEKYTLSLTPDMIGGNYENRVRISIALPQDDANLVTMGLRLADGKYISAQTFRDKYLGQEVPGDESLRIAFEELMQSDEMRNYRLQRAGEIYFKEDFLEIAFDTPFMPAPPEGFEWYKDEKGKAKLRKTPPQLPGPTAGAPPMEPNMNGGTPGAPIGQPSMPPGGAMPMGEPPTGAPMTGPPPIQPEAILSGPQGGGFPPVMQGQMEPETLGMPQDSSQLQFDPITGTPIPPQEELDLLAGQGGPLTP